MPKEDPGLEGRLGRRKKTPEELALETDPNYDPYAKSEHFIIDLNVINMSP